LDKRIIGDEYMIKIGDRLIGKDYKPFIIAEMSGNHNHSLERALHLVELAAQAGADAVKLQTYTPDTITLDVHTNEFFISNEKDLWKGQSLYNLYQKAYTPWEWHQAIFDKCEELGLLAFSSPFDETAVDFLEILNVPAYKIASFENVDIPLIKKVARTGKPIIISTGMATAAELDEAVRAVREEGNNQLVLLKCTSTYPATPENSNLATIPHMRDLFDVEIGLSDHTMGTGVSVAAHELKQLVEDTERAWQSIGHIQYGPTEAEKPSLNARRSLYIGEDMKAGDVFTKENLRDVRPGLGLPTKYYDILLGKTIKTDAIKGTPVSWELVL